MNLIAAVDERWGLGRQDELLARVPQDLRRFKALTLGGTVVLGRKTLQTFPHAAPLPGRDNIILSADPDFSCHNATIARSVPALLHLLETRPPQSVWSIGGASVYRQLLPYCRLAYITHFLADLQADCFLPALDASPSWRLLEKQQPFVHEDLHCCFALYENLAPLPIA